MSPVETPHMIAGTPGLFEVAPGILGFGAHARPAVVDDATIRGVNSLLSTAWPPGSLLRVTVLNGDNDHRRAGGAASLLINVQVPVGPAEDTSIAAAKVEALRNTFLQRLRGLELKAERMTKDGAWE